MPGKQVSVLGNTTLEGSSIFDLQANAIGRSSKTASEFLEKNYTEGLSRDDTIKLTIKSLLEVVQTGAKNIEISIMEGYNKITVRPLSSVDRHVQPSDCCAIESGPGSNRSNCKRDRTRKGAGYVVCWKSSLRRWYTHYVLHHPCRGRTKTDSSSSYCGEPSSHDRRSFGIWTVKYTTPFLYTMTLVLSHTSSSRYSRPCKILTQSFKSDVRRCGISGPFNI